jgi:hypothetical protein
VWAVVGSDPTKFDRTIVLEHPCAPRRARASTADVHVGGATAAVRSGRRGRDEDDAASGWGMRANK